ncbi:MAG TPA: PepSY domain-containing protein [Methanobacterium sp.]|nr:PepSY domain-containing protein [Methanobacterium sp.]
MIDTKILISIVIVLLIGVAAASYQISTKTPGVWQPSVSQAPLATDQGSSDVSSAGQGLSGLQQISSSSSSSGQSRTGGVEVKVSPEDAQNKVQTLIQVPNFLAGSPTLTTLDGQEAYYVPVLNGTKKSGEFYVDAQTGEIIEGAGGVS